MSEWNQGRRRRRRRAARGGGALLKGVALIISAVFGGIAKLFGRAGGRGR